MHDPFGLCDGARDDVRKETDEGGVRQKIACRLQAFVAVHQVHDLCQGKEANTKGKRQLRKVESSMQEGDLPYEKINVFERSQVGYVGEQSDLQPPLAR